MRSPHARSEPGPAASAAIAGRTRMPVPSTAPTYSAIVWMSPVEPAGFWAGAGSVTCRSTPGADETLHRAPRIARRSLLDSAAHDPLSDDAPAGPHLRRSARPPGVVLVPVDRYDREPPRWLRGALPHAVP